MAKGKGIREVGYIDCAGGGQVVVKGGIAYIGNMSAPDGTAIYDVRDPKHPKELATGTHSHKVRVENDLMVVNREVNPYQIGAPSDFKGGWASTTCPILRNPGISGIRISFPSALRKASVRGPDPGG